MPDSLTQPAIRLAGDGLGISVSSSSTALLQWLCEFWHPWLTGTKEPEARGPWLEVDTTPGALAQALDGAVATGAHAACFTLDNGGGEWALYHSSDGEVALDDTGTVALSLSDDPSSPIRVLGHADDGVTRLAALRVVREIITAQAYARNAISLHASAVATPDHSVSVFVGSKGAGKTTRLLSSLSQPDTSFVANDRVLLRLDAGTFRVHGLPTIVALRPPTLALFPDLASEVASDRWHFAATAADGDDFRREQRALSERLGRGRGISPAQLCTIVGRPAAAGGVLKQIVFPRPDPGDDRALDATPLDPDAAAARILAGGLVAGGRSATYLPGTAQLAPARLEAVVRALVLAVPCFDAPAVAGTAKAA